MPAPAPAAAPNPLAQLLTASIMAAPAAVAVALTMIPETTPATERMKELPVLLERMLPSGKDANAVLASLQENLGFDPLSEKGMRAAGLDPSGGLAWVSLRADKGVANAAVATISEVEVRP